MTPDDAISLFAELSLGLAGFAGVGAAFAGRSREFLPLERMRLISVVSLSASVLAGSLAYVTVSFASESASLRASAATSLAASLGMLFLIGPPLIRARSRSSAESERWVLPASIGLLLVATLLYAFSTWIPTSFGLLAAAFSLQLLHALWLFVRLLTRVN
jgi:hypothetical protein